MAEFKLELTPYDLRAALEADSSAKCLVIDVGRNADGQPVPSLKLIEELVDSCMHRVDAPMFAVSKLYIVGEWELDPPPTAEEEGPALDDKEMCKDIAVKWAAATEKIKSLLEQMSNLTEVTWIASLPFTASVWEKLPTSLTKLVLDLGEPVRLDHDGGVLHKSYITPNEMKPLQEQVKLKELRLFRVHESFQPIVWETVYRNKSSGGMRVLDVQMASSPIVRSEQWKKAKDVAGLTVPTEQSPDKEYKGKDGKGILHYSIGTGEYLDDLCMRKARIASGLDEATPLPLWCLRLDGFVIDHLPFQHELSRIVALTCGENCIDSGLRAPQTDRAPRNKWSKAVNNAASHCLIQWPNWCGVFDDHGDQRDRDGVVVRQDMALSTPIDEFPSSPTMPLTEELLQMKTLDDALEDIKKPDYFAYSPVLADSATATLETVSNLSERGSDVPTPTTTLPPAAYAPPAIVTGRPEQTESILSTDSSLVVVDGMIESWSPTSTRGSFEIVSPSISQAPSFTTTEDSNAPAVEENKTPKKTTLAHKVRRSLDWLSGSSS